MPPVLPTFVKTTAKQTFPKTPPYSSVGDYLASKLHLQEHSHFRSYQWDKPGHDPPLHLTACQRVYEDTKKKLAARREFAKKEHLKLKAQWDDLYEQELKFKETFVNLNHFVRSNEEKRKRAERKRMEDYILRIQRTKETDKLKKRIDIVVESKRELDENIEKLRIYEQYLNSVVTACEDFRNADSLISRYESLVSTRNLLGRRQNENLELLENARAKTSKLIEENSFKILGLNNIVNDLNKRYNTAARKALHWENVVLTIKTHSFQRYQEINEVKQSCYNLYLLMCRRKAETPKIEENDFENQLIFIKKTLQELETVKEMTKNYKYVPNKQKQRSKTKKGS